MKGIATTRRSTTTTKKLRFRQKSENQKIRHQYNKFVLNDFGTGDSTNHLAHRSVEELLNCGYFIHFQSDKQIALSNSYNVTLIGFDDLKSLWQNKNRPYREPKQVTQRTGGWT